MSRKHIHHLIQKGYLVAIALSIDGLKNVDENLRQYINGRMKSLSPKQVEKRIDILSGLKNR